MSLVRPTTAAPKEAQKPAQSTWIARQTTYATKPGDTYSSIVQEQQKLGNKITIHDLLVANPGVTPGNLPETINLPETKEFAAAQARTNTNDGWTVKLQQGVQLGEAVVTLASNAAKNYAKENPATAAVSAAENTPIVGDLISVFAAFSGYDLSPLLDELFGGEKKDLCDIPQQSWGNRALYALGAVPFVSKAGIESALLAAKVFAKIKPLLKNKNELGTVITTLLELEKTHGALIAKITNKIVSMGNDDAARLLTTLSKHSSEAVVFLSKYGEEGIDLLAKHGKALLTTVKQHGDWGFAMTRKAGNRASELFGILSQKEGAQRFLAVYNRIDIKGNMAKTLDHFRDYVSKPVGSSSLGIGGRIAEATIDLVSAMRVAKNALPSLEAGTATLTQINQLIKACKALKAAGKAELAQKIVKALEKVQDLPQVASFLKAA